jgi:acetyl esterase
MAVDPQFLDTLAMMKTVPPARHMPLDLVRTQPFPGFENKTPVARMEDREIPTPDGPLAVRIYIPRVAEKLPLLVFFHGGGFIVGGLNSHDEIARALSVAADAIVVSVLYRLAPENPFPAASDDSVAAILWAFAHADEIGADGGRVAVAGDSAGGNLCAVAALRLRDTAGPKLAAQLLIYPATDLTRPRKGSMLETAEGFYISQDDMDFFFDSYVGNGDPGHPHISPLFAESLADLPPALVITAECDPLRDQGLAYAKRLEAEGVATRLEHYEGAIHGFLTNPCPMGSAAIHQSGEWLRQIFVQ